MDADNSPTGRSRADELMYKVSAEQIMTVARGSPVNLFSGVAAAMLLAAGALVGGNNRQDLIRVSLWFGLISLGLLAGVRLAAVLLKKSESPTQIHRDGRWFVLNCAFCGLIWGSASWVMLPAAGPGNELFVLVGIAMVMMGGSGAQAAHRPLAYVFTLAVTVVFALGLARFPDFFHRLYALAFILLCFVTLMSSRNQERALRYQILFRMERDELTHVTEEARAQSEIARLEAEAARKEAELANRAKTVF